MTEKEFYKLEYEKIKRTEEQLLLAINEKINVLNAKCSMKTVEHILSRIKTPQSAINKLKLAGYEQSGENAVAILSDVIGIRVITHFIGDIYSIRNYLVNSGEFVVLKEKDYVREAKPSGYRGYHIIIQTEIDGFKIKAEIQLRTIAMDCWASLEHEIRYKKGIENTDLINFELKKCSDDLMSADIAMEQIWSIVRNSSANEVEADEGCSEN